MAPLPAGIDGHFGPELRRFVLAQYHQGQVTVPRLVALLRGFGIVISKRQIVRLLIAGKRASWTKPAACCVPACRARPGSRSTTPGRATKPRTASAPRSATRSSPGSRTTGSKSRLNFLELLRAGHGDYVINAEALAYMRARALAGPVIARLAEHADRAFADRAAWNAHLDRLGISALNVNPDPVLIATEGALWGSIKAHGSARRHRDRQR